MNNFGFPIHGFQPPAAFFANTDQVVVFDLCVGSKMKLLMRQLKMIAAAMFFCCGPVSASKIYFCGELIPTSREFVAHKLMNIIRNQIPNVTLSTLHARARYYFPYIEKMLRDNHIPDDFKYIPIVECAFRNHISTAGARGFWQLMPNVARNLGLEVTPDYDERDYPARATAAACKLILQQYNFVKRNIGVSSWVLTAACYNFGTENIRKNVQRQGADFFSMKLNAETAEYIYRLIAVKELFERPELYMNGFGDNIFNQDAASPGGKVKYAIDEADTGVNMLKAAPARTIKDKDYESLEVRFADDDKRLSDKGNRYYFYAHIVRGSGKFTGSGPVSIRLDNDINLNSSFYAAGEVLTGTGWLIDDRVYLDLGLGREMTVLDKRFRKGLTPKDIATRRYKIILEVIANKD